MARLPVPLRMALGAMGVIGGLLAVVQLTGAVRPVDLLSPALHGQGSEVVVADFGDHGIRQEDPYDGQYIYVTARLLPDLDAVTDAITESDFRLVRILHPLLASPASPGNGTIHLLQLWNLVGVGLFVGAMADLLQRHGFDPRWAAAGAVACGFSIQYTTSEPLAFGLAMAGLALLDRDRLVGASALLALGGLTRETALTFAVAGAALLLARRRRLAAGVVLAAASLPTIAWWAYVQSITERSRVPAGLLGILDLPELWAPNIAASLLVVGLTVVSVVAWWDVPAFRWLALGFAAWLPLYERYSFTVAALPRLTIPSVALGLAGLARWRLGPSAAPPDGARSDGRGSGIGSGQPLR